MIELTTLGGRELRRDGNDIRSVLSQPKRLALLVYLRLAAPGGFVSRDRLLALFWPESDDERARNALRQSLHFLRRSLGDGVVVSRSEQEVGVDAGLIACDAVAFLEELTAGRLEDAVERYRGELLPGFHIDDAPELERWLDETRGELARRAVEAAWMLAERAEGSGELAAAAMWTRRLVALDPYSEAGVRRLMELLARAGERARALEACEELERRLAQDLELEPSAETMALADRIRSGDLDPAPGLDPSGPLERRGASKPTQPPVDVDPADVHLWTEPPALRSAAARPPGATRRTRAVAMIAGAAAAVVAGGSLLGSWHRTGDPPAVAEPPAIAVMPFMDMSQDGAQEYFSDGIAEEILNVLARVPGLRVAARTSSFAFRDTKATADSIGRALGVSHLLEGSVRTVDDRVRITVQLIDTRGGFHLWSETYDRRFEDLFRLQDEISREVAERLASDLSPVELTERSETTDPAAHELYLRGRHAWNRRTPGSVRSAIDLFEQAVQRDPGYARAWAGLAEALVVLPQYEGTPAGPSYDRAEAAARKALALDPGLAEAHAALGLRHINVRDGLAEQHFREALRLNPNYATAYHWYSIYFGERGRYDDQLREILQARSLDPLSPIIQVNVAKAYLHLRRFDESVTAYRQLLATEPNFGFGHALLAEALACAGHHQEAVASARRALQILGGEAHSEALTTAGYALALAGDHDAVQPIVQALERDAETPGVRPGAWGPAQVYVGLGDYDRALHWVERAVENNHWGGRPDLPWFDALREAPRFQEILQRFDRS